MKFSGQQLIDAPPARAYAALVDPLVLRDCIPGCEELEKVSDTDFKAKVKLKIGPVSASFSGAVQLTECNPPHGCLLAGHGDAGMAGFAKGTARVRLEEQGDATMLQWDAEVQLGGKIAQLGGRLVASVSKKLTGQFFTAFAAHFEGPAAEAAAPSRRKLRAWHLMAGVCAAIAVVAIAVLA